MRRIPTTCEAESRLFEHEFLEGEPVCIPENPQRVVALEMAGAELTLFTDKVLVGTNSWVKQDVAAEAAEIAPLMSFDFEDFRLTTS